MPRLLACSFVVAHHLSATSIYKLVWRDFVGERQMRRILSYPEGFRWTFTHTNAALAVSDTSHGERAPTHTAVEALVLVAFAATVVGKDVQHAHHLGENQHAMTRFLQPLEQLI